jgi:chromosome partitioning protein
MVASNHVLIPVCPEYQPVIGAEQVFQTCMMVRKKLNPSLEKPKFLFTMVDARKRSHAQYRHYLRGKYEDDVMRTIIRTSAALATSDRDGRTVFTKHPRARGSIDYANAADELLTGYLKLDSKQAQPAQLAHVGV